MGEFGKRRLKLFGVLMIGFSFFILKFIGSAVCATWRQSKCLSSKLFSLLTNRSSAVQNGGMTGEEFKADRK